MNKYAYDLNTKENENGSVEPELIDTITAEMVEQYKAEQNRLCAEEIQRVLEKYSRTLQPIAEVRLIKR